MCSEIFDIVSALESAEGKGTTFYSFLNTTKQADDKAIAKAYRKRSLELQSVSHRAGDFTTALVYTSADLFPSCRSPDKNPNDKKIQDRFARLGVIANILKDAEKRKRSVAQAQVCPRASSCSRLTVSDAITATTTFTTTACPSGVVRSLGSPRALWNSRS